MSRPKSLALRQNAFLRPPSQPEIADGDVQPQLIKQKRHANVYDAVAGRVSSNGFIVQTPFASKHRDTLSSNSVALPPEEVLFRRKRASTRFVENDFYFANESLGPDQPLSDSDLLKTIHCYASDFYANATVERGQGNWRSMDETALIAMGILLEEAAREGLGRTGDMVFVEGGDGSDIDDGIRTRIGKFGEHRASERSPSLRRDNEESQGSERPMKKRRRVEFEYGEQAEDDI